MPGANPGDPSMRLVGLDILNAQRDDLYEAIAEFKASYLLG